MGEGEDGVGEKDIGAATITINVSKTNPAITPITIHTSGPAPNIAAVAVLPNPNTVLPVL